MALSRPFRKPNRNNCLRRPCGPPPAHCRSYGWPWGDITFKEKTKSDQFFQREPDWILRDFNGIDIRRLVHDGFVPIDVGHFPTRYSNDCWIVAGSIYWGQKVLGTRRKRSIYIGPPSANEKEEVPPFTGWPVAKTVWNSASFIIGPPCTLKYLVVCVSLGRPLTFKATIIWSRHIVLSVHAQY